MRAGSVQPSGVERMFDADEIIVTKTDLKGRITYANDVFLRVSAYTEEDVMGQPHSMIRHPAMPRCVFQLLWDTLAAGDEMFAYILNLAGDGAHYWVFAHITPSFDSQSRPVGYHSNRRLPARSAIAQIQPLYAQLRAAEARHPRPVEAMGASSALLASMLADRGMTYDQFVWSLAGSPALT